jgi:hypothetical protein
MIRGQHGQATQNVLQQRQEDQTQAQIDEQNKYQQQNLALAKQNQAMNAANMKFQNEQAKQAGKMSMIGTGINAIGTIGNLYNQTGGFGGLGSTIGSGVSSATKKLGSGLSSIFSSIFS